MSRFQIDLPQRLEGEHTSTNTVPVDWTGMGLIAVGLASLEPLLRAGKSSVGSTRDWPSVGRCALRWPWETSFFGSWTIRALVGTSHAVRAELRVGGLSSRNVGAALGMAVLVTVIFRRRKFLKCI